MVASRAALLALVLAGIAGCFPDPYGLRDPCDASAADCCPPGSHDAHDVSLPSLIVCIPDDMPSAEAGADTGPCDDAGTDAH
jgi:hypothetical protein